MELYRACTRPYTLVYIQAGTLLHCYNDTLVYILVYIQAGTLLHCYNDTLVYILVYIQAGTQLHCYNGTLVYILVYIQVIHCYIKLGAVSCMYKTIYISIHTGWYTVTLLQ